jgi:hypothetical protein
LHLKCSKPLAAGGTYDAPSPLVSLIEGVMGGEGREWKGQGAKGKGRKWEREEQGWEAEKGEGDREQGEGNLTL